MTERELVAYALMAVMLIAIAGAIAWSRYNSRDRKTERQRNRDEARYLERRELLDAARSKTSRGSGEG